MDENKFLELSNLLQDLPLAGKIHLHAYRYKHFVANSSRGHNCTYARMTREQFLSSNESPTLFSLLLAIPDMRAQRALSVLRNLQKENE